MPTFGRGTVFVPSSDIAKSVQTLADQEEFTGYGDTWHILGAATAALTAVPGTTAGHSIWNGEVLSTKIYQIISIGAVEIVTDATQQNSLAIFCMMNKGAITAPTDAGLARGSMSGRNYGGMAKMAAGMTVVDDVWTPVGPSSPGATAFAGAVWRVTEANVVGHGFYVPPSGLFSVAAVKTVATASQIRYFIRWKEVPRLR